MKQERIEDKIKTLNPDVFKQLHMQATAPAFNKNEKWNDFHIKDLASKDFGVNFPLPAHRKTVNHFVYIHKGCMVRTVNIDRFVSDDNSITMMPALTINETLSMDQGTQGYYCHYSDEFLMNCSLTINEFTRLQSVLPVFLKFDTTCATIVYNALKHIARLHQNKERIDLIRQYLLTLLKEIEVYTEQHKASSRQQAEMWVEKVKLLITKNIYKSRNVSFYGSLMNLSPNHFNKLIKKHTGISAIALINKIVALESKVLLLQTDLSISQIAFELNFNDSAHFSNFFSKHTNMSPSVFRKMIDMYKK